MFVLQTIVVVAWFAMQIRNWWLRKKKSQQLKRLPESTRSGSEYYTTKHLPRFLVSYHQYANGNREYLGTGYVDGDWIVVPRHVLTNTQGEVHIRFGDEFYILPKCYTPKVLEGYETHPEVKMIAPDVMLLKKPQIPGLRSAKVGPVSGRVMAQAMCAKETQNTTNGQVYTPKKDGCWAMLHYDGSTSAGFSGGVYLIGERVVGMHIGGGAVNYGVAASWVHTRIQTKESSELNALRNALKTARKKDVQYAETGDPDLVEVRVNGRYYQIERDELRQLKEEERRERETEEFDTYHDDDTEQYGRRAARSRRGRGWKDFEMTHEQFGREVGESLPSRVLESQQPTSFVPDVNPAVTIVEVHDEPIRLVEPEPLARLPEELENWSMFSSDESDDEESKNGEMPSLARHSLSSAIPLPDTMQPQPSTSEIPTMTSPQQDTAGLETLLAKFCNQFVSTLELGNARLLAELSSHLTKQSELLQNMKSSTVTRTPAPPCQENQAGTSGSTNVSAGVTSAARPVLGTSRGGPQLAKPWDGMDSAVTIIRTFLRSNDSSNPEYPRLYQGMLDGLKLSVQRQERAVVEAMKKERSRLRRKRRRAQLRVAGCITTPTI